jgi:hypothetical protein
MNDDSINNPPLSFFHTVAIVALILAVLSFVSPQVGSLGRGYRTTLPALVISFGAISLISPSAFFRSISRYKLVLLFSFLFLLQAAFRFAHEDRVAEVSWHTFFKGPSLALINLIWIGAFSELGERAVRRFRSWFLLGWCTSLALGVPVLIKHLGVARLTMGSAKANQNAAIWAPYGVGEYSVYTSMAVCLAPLYTLAVLQRNLIIRWISLILICLAGMSVIISTFAMASILITLSFAGVLLIGIKSSRGFSRLLRIMVVGSIILMAPVLYFQARQFPQTAFLVEKLERIQKGVTKSGLEKGDSTSRGRLFLADINGFMESPIVGYIPGIMGNRDHGHSSLANSLTLFGLFGTTLWVFVMYWLYRDGRRYAGSQMEVNGVQIAWIVLLLGGIPNPTWHSPAVLSALFALTVSTRKKADQTSESQVKGAR